jgi:hypothetical protein
VTDCSGAAAGVGSAETTSPPSNWQVITSSTEEFIANPWQPIAARAQSPASPNTSTSNSVAPLMTRG